MVESHFRLKYRVHFNKNDFTIIKWTILFTIAQLFDPLSLVASVFVYVKIILQKL